MTLLWLLPVVGFLSIQTNEANIKLNNLPEVNVIEISQQLLLQAKTHEQTDSFVQIIHNVSEHDLEKQLLTDDDKKAFWINIYNAFTQIILSKNPDKYKKRSTFFKDRQITIAGKKLNLDDIEHGLLRHSKIKWSLGYINKFFPSSFEKKNRVKALDYRLHFALNCGAKSCPPIAFYKSKQLGKQLDLATNAYLNGECEYSEADNLVKVPALMSWFRGDFGGKKKELELLRKTGVIPADKSPAIVFKKYDWSLFLENYKSE